jgi:hypothetical protein
MKFRDIMQGQTLSEGEMKFQALGIAKELHNKLAQLTFIDMLAVMSSDNPAKKEVQELETKVNALTTEVGAFIQKYIPDVADAEIGDLEDEEDEDDEDEEEEKVKKKVEKPKVNKPRAEEPKQVQDKMDDKAKNESFKQFFVKGE